MYMDISVYMYTHIVPDCRHACAAHPQTECEHIHEHTHIYHICIQTNTQFNFTKMYMFTYICMYISIYVYKYHTWSPTHLRWPPPKGIYPKSESTSFGFKDLVPASKSSRGEYPSQLKCRVAGCVCVCVWVCVCVCVSMCVYGRERQRSVRVWMKKRDRMYLCVCVCVLVCLWHEYVLKTNDLLYTKMSMCAKINRCKIWFSSAYHGRDMVVHYPHFCVQLDPVSDLLYSPFQRRWE